MTALLLEFLIMHGLDGLVAGHAAVLTLHLLLLDGSLSEHIRGREGSAGGLDARAGRGAQRGFQVHAQGADPVHVGGGDRDKVVIVGWERIFDRPAGEQGYNFPL